MAMVITASPPASEGEDHTHTHTHTHTHNHAHISIAFSRCGEVTCISMHAHTLDGLVDARFERVVGSQHGVCKSRLSWVTSRYLLSAGSTLQSGLSRRYGRLTQVCVFVREKNISSSVFVCVCMNLCSRIPRIHA